MNKARTLLAAGLGAMTPAFIVTEGLQAHPVAPAAVAPVAIPTDAGDQAALKSALLQLSPTEKLRSAGDRIRLGKYRFSNPSMIPALFPSYQNNCSGMLFLWK